MKEIEEHEAEKKKILESKIEIIENINTKSMSGFVYEKRIRNKRIRKIDIELEKPKNLEKLLIQVKKYFFSDIICEYYGLYELELESE